MIPRPGELLIMTLPGKSGLYLAVAEERDRPQILARFAGDGEWASKRFAEALEGLGLRYRRTEEDTDGVLREQAEEAGERPGGGLGVPGAEGDVSPAGGEGPAGAPAEGRAA